MRPASIARLAVALLAIVAIALSLMHLRSMGDGLFVTTDHAGSIPVTVFRQASGESGPAVLIAHGFAGSQQLMQPFAITLARNGYVAITFDFPGHGRNPNALNGGLADAHAMQRDLLGTLDQMAHYARGLAGTDGRLAVLGHSMAADVVVRYAHAHDEVQATIAVSLFLPKPEAFQPRNLLIIDGAVEARALREQAYQIIGAATGHKPEADVTYGTFADGSARRLTFARDVEHIGVLYSGDSMRASLTWLNQNFNQIGNGFLDTRGQWLGLLFMGLVALAWPLASLLPQIESPPHQRAFGWRVLLPVALVPALLTPLMLWRLPTDFLPILLGDYLTLHFALYGFLTVGALWLLRRRVPTTTVHAEPWKFALAAIAVCAYSLLALGLPLNAYVISFMPGPWRLLLVAAVMAGTLPYFVADEWLTRRAAPLRGAYAITKFCFLLSLVIAVALNLEKLFFLIITIPAILLLFAIYGLFSAWINRRTGRPLLAALSNAFVFAWFIGVTFPIVSR